MNMRETIRLRCLDCEGRDCKFTRCGLFNLGKRSGKGNRSMAIRRYCRECMNGNRINECAAMSCSIYQYRKTVRGDLRVNFLPVLTEQGGYYEV